MSTGAKRALYDNLEKNEVLTLALDAEVRKVKQDGWRGNRLRERELKLAVKKVLPSDFNLDAVFDLIKNQREY